jgi:hypothetical protein
MNQTLGKHKLNGVPKAVAYATLFVAKALQLKFLRRNSLARNAMRYMTVESDEK